MRPILKFLGFLDNGRQAKTVAWCLWGTLLALVAFLAGTAEDWPGALARRTALERKVRVLDYAHSSLWYGCLAIAILLLLLGLTRRFWLVPKPEPTAIPAPRSSLVWWILLGVILAGAIALRLPRLSLSLYNDEEYAVRNYLHGKYTANPGEAPDFRPAPWLDTFFLNREGNNQVLSNVLSRVCLETWKAVHRVEERFSVPVTRIPALLGGLGSILVIALLMKESGGRAGGLVAAAALALHPWHIRYSTETRGYGLVFLWATLVVYAANRALQTRQWRWWIAFGLAEFALLSTYQAAIYLAVTVNLTIAAWIFFRDKPNRHPQFARWIVSNLLGAMGTILIMAPSVIETLEYLHVRRSHGDISLDWARNFWCWIAAGTQWNSDDPANPLIRTVLGLMAGGHFLPFVLAAFLTPLLLILGLRVVIRSSGGWLMAAGLASALLGIAHAVHGEIYLFLWYLIFILPFFVAFTSAAAAAFWDSTRQPTLLSALPILIWLGVFSAVTIPQTAIFLKHPKEPLLNAVRAVYGDRDPFGPEAGEVWVQGFFTSSPIHAPRILTQGDINQFAANIEKGIDAGKPIFVIYGHRPLARIRTPAHLALVENPELFEQVSTFHGLEEAQYSHYVARFTGTREALDRILPTLPETPENKDELFDRDHSKSSE